MAIIGETEAAMVRAFLLAIAIGLALPGHAAEARKYAVISAAAEARTYAVVSILGDKFTIVRAKMSTGTSLRRPDRQAVAFPDPVIDKAALFAVERALQKHDKDAKAILLLVREPSVLETQDRLMQENGATQELFEALRKAAAGTQATHLILVSKLRHEAVLRFESS